jgi:hypothetical protein
MLKNVPAPVVFAAVAPLAAALVSDVRLTVGNATVASAGPPVAAKVPLLTLTEQVFAVTAPVNVMVPSDAWLASGSDIAVLMPATIIARLIKVFTSSPPI